MTKISNNKSENYNENTFDSIKCIDGSGNEYWEARKLQFILEYAEWRNFELVINKAKLSCANANYNVCDHFVDINKTIPMPKKANRNIIDYKLSRYACYLIVQNADPKKKVVALGQTYFAVQTRKQEITEKEYERLSEDEKRLYNRKIAKRGNYQLNIAAKEAGVKNFDKFHNCGYKGLYNGETAADIAKRKELRYREDILDNMASDELAANIFRISQAKQKIENDNIKSESDANNAHYKVGKIVREAIKKTGGTLPENLSTPNKSLKEIKKEKHLIK
jgi:DNA-damage-inducible protein D